MRKQLREKIKLLHLLDDIKDPVRKMDLLITLKFCLPSLFMAEELRKKVKPGYINLIGLEIMNWQKNMEPFMVELPYVFDTHDEWLPTNETDRELTERFNLTGYLLLKLGILIMMMRCYGQNMIRLMIQLLF